MKNDGKNKTQGPLRIAMLGHKRIPSREGGVEIVVEQLSVRMAALGNRVTCFNRKGHHVGGRQFDGETKREYKGVRLRTVPAIDAKGLSAMSASVFGGIRAAFGPYDVVHFHAEGPCAMLWLPKLTGKRCIATIHGLDHRRAKWGRFARAYIMLGERTAARFADEIIVLSRGVQEYFRAAYGRETAFIPNGVDLPRRRPPRQITEKFGLTGGDYILFLARLVPEKGLEYLIRAFRGLDTRKKLVIAGGASDTASFEQAMKELAAGDDRILFTGFVQGQLLEELYSSAFVYVLPSDLEGMPLSLLEAMSYGNCCLVSDIEECASVVEKNGVTFRRGDVEDLRRKLAMLCADEALVGQYKAAAAPFICAKYNWDDVTERTLALYRGEAPAPQAERRKR